MERQYATLKDVAERAGTTAATVSYVLNRSEKRYVSEDMRRRVLAAADELNYVKSSAASSLKGKKRKIIAVLVPQYANQFFTELILGVEEVADKYGYILSICNTFDNSERELDVIRRMMAQRVDGFIITPGIDGGKNTRQIRKMGIPMVAVDRSMDIKSAYFSVSAQNYESADMAVRYLLNRGHRHIAYIGWDVTFGGLERRKQAYRDAMEQVGVQEQDLVMYDGEFTPESGALMTQRMLEEHSEITAVLYAYNIQAKGGVDYLAQHNVLIGQELSVVIIGAPDWVQTGCNRFTCVDLNGKQIGGMSAEMLFDIINSDEPMEPYQLVQEATLKEGNSVCQL